MVMLTPAPIVNSSVILALSPVIAVFAVDTAVCWRVSPVSTASVTRAVLVAPSVLVSPLSKARYASVATSFAEIVVNRKSPSM